MNVQALWFRKDLWTERSSKDWCEEHQFKSDSPQHNNDHWIWRQLPIVEDAVYRVIADDFPEGVSATVMEEREDEKMDKKIKTGIQSEASPFTFILSTEDKDRDGDIVRQDGIDLKDFKKNPIALYQHDHRQPIGIWKNIRFEGRKLLADLQLAALGTSELIDTIHKLIEQRILRAVSIGFMVHEVKAVDEKDPWKGFEFIKTSLLEASLVSVPANQNALRAKAAKIIPDELKSVLMPEVGQGRNTRAHNAKLGTQKSARTGLALRETTSDMKGKRPMNIAERIRAKEERLVAVKDRQTELKNLLENDEEYEFSPEEEAEIEALKAEQESIIKSIETMKGIMSSLAAKAQPVRPNAPSTPAKAAAKERGGSLLIKSIAVQLISHMTKAPQSEVMEMMYGDDDRVKAVSKVYGNQRRLFQKSTVDAADTTTVGWAAELVRDDLRGFLEELRAVSIYAQLLAAPGAQSLDFGGANTITIPRRNRNAQSAGAATGLSAAAHLGAQMGGSWVGEGGVIPVKNMALSSQTMSRYKLAVIAAMTNEILEQSVPNIEGIIRNAILEDTALAVDGALLDGLGAVAGVRPASPFNGAQNQASSGTTAANIITDLKYLLSLLSAINGANPVLIMNSNRLLGLSTVTTAAGGFMFRDEIASGRLMGVPVLSSTTVNPATVGILDAGSFVGANDAPAFAISDQATLTMANADGTAPTQAGAATDHTGGALGTIEQVPPDGGIVVAGTPTGASVAGYMAQSMFQQYQTAIRMVMPASWGMTRNNAAGYLTGVAW